MSWFSENILDDVLGIESGGGGAPLPVQGDKLAQWRTPDGTQWNSQEAYDYALTVYNQQQADQQKQQQAAAAEQQRQTALQQQQQQQQQAEAQRVAAEQAAAAQAQQQAAAAAEQKMNAAYTGAQQYGANRLSAQGITKENDPYGLYGAHEAELARIKGTIPAGADPNQYYNPAVFDTVYNTRLTDERAKLQREYDTMFPSNFAQTTFSDTSDDQILNAILGEQYNEARSSVEMAGNRGQINERGLAASLSELDKAKTAGMSKLQGIGGGVLGGYRTQVGEQLAPTKSAVQSFNFTPVNLGAAKTGINTFASGLRGGLEGDIRSALGGLSYFDAPTLIQKGGIAGGVTNTGLMARPSDYLLDEFKKQEADRQAAPQGAF